MAFRPSASSPGLQRLAEQLVGQADTKKLGGGAPSALRMREGVVQSLDSTTTCTVQIGADPNQNVPGMRWLMPNPPRVGDFVSLFEQGTYRLIVGVISNGIQSPYRTQVYQTNTQNVVHDTPATLVLDTVLSDANTDFGSNTYTAPIDGWYWCSGGGALNNGLQTFTQFLIRLTLNGTTVKTSPSMGGNGTYQTPMSTSVSGLFRLTAGDTMTVAIRQKNGSSATIVTQAGREFCWFDAAYIGPQ